ncbi:MAG: TonB-dependent receptor [Chitinophagaceae bacterium]
MWVKQILLCVFLCVNGLWIFAQPATVITVRVVNKKQEPIPQVSLQLLNSGQAALSDTQGFIQLSLPVAGSYRAILSADGFATQEIIITYPSAAMPVYVLVTEVEQLGEVIVRSDRKETTLQQVTTAVTSFNEKSVQAFRLWKTADLAGLVPNLYTASPGDGRNITALRGIVSTSYDPAVNTAIDGVTQFTLDTYIPQLFDVVNIEILRGPQGTLYGRNAMGGVINILTRQPDNKRTGFAEISAGNYGTGRYTAGLQMPLIKDKLYAGAALLYQHSNGFYTNTLTNTRFDRQSSAGGNYYIKYRPGSRFTATVNLKHLYNASKGAFTLAGSPQDALQHPYEVQQDAVSKMKDKTWNASLALQYAGTGVNILLQSAWQSNYRYYVKPLDGDFSPIDGITIVNNYGRPWNKTKVQTHELRFSSPARQLNHWDWVGGIYYFEQKSPTRQGTHFGKDAAWVGSPDIDYTIISTSCLRNTGAAIYGQVIYKITDRINIKGGLRYDWQRTKLGVLGEYQPDGSPAPVFNTREDTSASRRYSALSPVASISYQASKESRFYLSYSRGYRTGGLTQLSSDPAQPPLYAYRPEYSNTIELGVKNMLWQNRLRLNVALFYNTVNDAQVPTLILPEAFTVTRNAGRLRSTGAELELAALLIKGLQLDYRGGYTHATYQTLHLPKDGQDQDFNGNRQIYTPAFTSMLALQYERSINQKRSVYWQLRGELVCFGSQFFDLANTIKQTPYQLTNLKTGISFKHFSIMVWARNVFDRRYIAYAYEFGAARLGDPRTVGVSVQTRW